MEKPEKYNWREILIKPIVSFVYNLIEAVKINYLGYWYCHGCKKLHSPRVKKFYIKGKFNLGNRLVCSLHKDKVAD